MKPTVNFKIPTQKSSNQSNSKLQSYVYPITQNLKQLPNNNKQRPQQLETNKQNSDLYWLEKIVHQFQMYKDLKNDSSGDSLFGDRQYLKNNNDDDDLFLKDSEISQSNKTKQKSQRSQRKQIVQQNKRYFNKSKEIKHQVYQKNQMYAKSNINVKNKRSESQNNGFNKNKQQFNIIQTPSQRHTTIKFQQKQTQLSSKKTIQAHRKQVSNLSNITQSFQPITNMNLTTDLIKMKQKLSIQSKRTNNLINKNIKTNQKIQSVKTHRKNLLQPKNSQQKSSVGKIIKNKSVQLKQKKPNFNSTYKVNIINMIENNDKNQIQNLLSKQKHKKLSNAIQNNLQHYLTNQFLQPNPTITTSQNPKKPLQINLYKSQQPKSQIQNKIHFKLIQQPKIIKQQIKNKEIQIQIKNIQNNITIQQQNQNKKYSYLILENRFEKIINKKQRKLNSSFGERKILHNCNTQTDQNNNLPTVQPEIMHTQPTTAPNFTNTDNQNNQKKEQSIIPTNSLSQNTPLHQNIRYVESTLNSQVMTQNSIVIQRQNLQKLNPQPQLPKFSKNPQQWNILQIYQKLDRKKLGILQSNNCGIQYISRQIRYILGPILQQILYQDYTYNFTNFVNRVQNILQNIKDSQIPSYKPEHYLKIKQYNNQKQQLQSIKNYQSVNMTKNIPQLSNTLKQKTNYINNLQPQSSSSKKYCYQTNFLIDTIQTQPLIYTNNKTNQNQQTNIKNKKQDKDNKFTQSQNKNIRFATFQDQQLPIQQKQNKFNSHRQYLPINKNKQQKFNQNNQENKNISIYQQQQQKFMKNKYEININSNNCNSNNSISISNNSISNINNSISISNNSISNNTRQRCGSQKSDKNQQKNNQKYKNQIVKLQILNQRLEKYLYDQNMKEFSTSKLVIENF